MPLSTSISKREYQILNLIAYEHSMLDIASILFISHHTVVTHRKNILRKLNAKNTAGLIRRAFEMGLLSVSVSAAA